MDDSGDLGVTVFGEVLGNPLGVGAGLDKGGDVVDVLFALGAGVVEVGELSSFLLSFFLFVCLGG